MKFKKTNDTSYLLLVEKEEELITCINKVVVQHNIKAASLSIIGGIYNPTLGYVKANSNDYKWKEFNGHYELIANGNVSWSELQQEPIIHIHAVIGDENFNSMMGHLKNTKIAVVGEVIISEISNDKIVKTLNPKIGFNCWDI